MTIRKGGASVDPRLEAWREPVRGGYLDPALFALPGIDQVRAVLDGTAPSCPLTHLIGLRLTESAPPSSLRSARETAYATLDP